MDFYMREKLVHIRRSYQNGGLGVNVRPCIFSIRTELAHDLTDFDTGVYSAVENLLGKLRL
ncbi:hypothetical protein RISK_000760 [Rhodopirellula islandica]|uniref:Uncharacterized protein n=1 Tax=Rhodopirellula islandica TaxID=595434 RepID=A0A0J1EN93_RHOIS|nr:hypothetical protein RISK_000760 [Rhodopirellula islandica]